MDQREWGLLRETVVRRTQASGASREDAEDATHDALLAAIGQPQHPQSEVAWVSQVAKRRRVDLIRQRTREQQGPGISDRAYDPTVAGPEDVVVDRAHASWLAESLTQLPATTREVVNAVGSGMAPAEVASAMNLSPRSVESHLTRARRHLRRMGALGLPLGALLGWTLRTRPGGRVVPAAVAVAVPAVVAAVVLLPSSEPVHSGPAEAPATALPAPAGTGPTPRSLPASGTPGAGLPQEGGPPASGRLPGSTVSDDPGAEPGAAGDGATRLRPQEPVSRSSPEDGPPQQCGLQLPVLGDLGCALVELVGGAVEQVPVPLPAQLPLPAR